VPESRQFARTAHMRANRSSVFARTAIQLDGGNGRVMIAFMIELADDGADPSLLVRSCHFTPRRYCEKDYAEISLTRSILFITHALFRHYECPRPVQCGNETRRRGAVVAPETRALYCLKMRATLENFVIATLELCSAIELRFRP
jgi:hypothetical protein